MNTAYCANCESAFPAGQHECNPDWQAEVNRFNDAIETPRRESPGWPDNNSGIPLALRLIGEEHCELVEAVHRTDIVETADAIGDCIVVLLGLARRLGIDMHPVMAEIQRSNMAKAGGPVRPDGKRLKPPGWTPPNIARVLRAQGWDGQ